MSRIMHELKQSSNNKPSFKGYQNHHVPSSARGISNKRGSSLTMGLILVLVPSLLVGGVLAYQSHNQQQQQGSASPVALPESKLQSDLEPHIASVDAVSVDADDEALFSVRSAPVSQLLKALPRQEIHAKMGTDIGNIASDSKAILANVDTSNQAATNLEPLSIEPSVQPGTNNDNATLQSDRDLLKGLDLTELSPDLALKLESMMGEQSVSSEPMDSRPVGNMDSQVIDLETHGNRLSGVLPKLDLQTHMYSSSETKRWVKVNGHEVAQGEWIERGIQLLEIKPQSVIIEFNQQKIEIPALYEWKG
ncbi:MULTISPECIES: general secretion pathway protein GspB [Vibrio]|uniref:General secretion pathway protein GspA n=1 Tax=Vibrio tasmaniensis TaxID=212663 RepID=A0A2N7NK35_9VIBR|nr:MULTISPECIES: general secretion pathway protein GspB [Vibrio]EAQ51602.1 General secretion pathway protein A [Vibrio sp. MED222]PMP15316.1 general secretion pathway protein GspA [Vibrio tasmaniensis]TKG31858.1 general secretion pathway protein GspA [Vibrio tasmaniensis]TKG41950.1 general secretion pathway protein GspA [Vibrio tasmaniensis]TKG47759.1 general secretion pathway protein GspA [Vibrio tasmaniensis]